MARIGIFGGTYDPPHIGHLIIAEEAVHQLKLDQLLWVLTPDPPHKYNKEITPLGQRLDMLQAAIAGNCKFVLSAVDIERPGPHYAYETIRLLSELQPENEWCYLMGADSLRDFPTWKHPELLLKQINILGVLSRQGVNYDLSVLAQEIPGILSKLQFIENPTIEISSSMIRERISLGLPFRYLIPQGVYRIIHDSGLYIPHSQ